MYSLQNSQFHREEVDPAYTPGIIQGQIQMEEVFPYQGKDDEHNPENPVIKAKRTGRKGNDNKTD